MLQKLTRFVFSLAGLKEIALLVSFAVFGYSSIVTLAIGLGYAVAIA